MKIQISKWLIVIATLVSLMFVVTGLEAKKGGGGKPDKQPRTNTELIVFQGDLQGWAHVEDCCPNAGPHPRYTMFLPDGLNGLEVEYPAGIYDGELFTKSAAGLDDEYTVQFHACCTHADSVDVCEEGLPELKFQIIGGDVVEVGRKKDRVLTADFYEADYWAQESEWYKVEYAGKVTFTIIRAPSSTDEIINCEAAFPTASVLQLKILCPSP